MTAASRALSVSAVSIRLRSTRCWDAPRQTFAADQRAIARRLVRNGRPTRRFHLARLDERTLGGLLMPFMLETIIAADLFGVNAFDQPAVKKGKVIARQYLGEMGREAAQ